MSTSSGISRHVRFLTSLAAAFTLAATATVMPVVLPGMEAALAPAAATTTYQVPWVADGQVRALADTGSGTYLGGDFSTMSLQAAGFAVTDPTTADSWRGVNRTFPVINGAVHAVISDGAGGWFVGGSFSQVIDAYTTLTNLLHVNADGSIDPNFIVQINYSSAQIDGQVRALALADGVLYVGGDFTAPQAALIALDASSGNTIGTFDITGQYVNALAVVPSGNGIDGAQVFAGGAMDHQSSTYQAAAFTCDVNGACDRDTTWLAQPDQPVSALALDAANDVLYLGGSFTTVDGSNPQNNLARVTASTGAVDNTWVPDPNATVLALGLDSTNGLLYAGGDFTAVQGSTNRPRLAAFATGAGAPGAPENWNPGADGTVRSLQLSADGQSIFAGGDFSAAGSGAQDYRSKLAQLSTADGTAMVLNLQPDNSVYAIALPNSGTDIAIGGGFTEIASVSRQRAASLDTNGGLTDWNPRPSGSVYSIAVVWNGVLLGGSFLYVGTPNSTTRYLALVDSSIGIPVPDFAVQPDGPVKAMVTRGPTDVFLGGSFNAFLALSGTEQRRLIARLTYVPSTWQVSSWSADLTGTDVRALVIGGSYVYAGGSFSQYSGSSPSPQARANAAAFTVSTGELSTSWNPSPNAAVNALAYSSYGQSVFLGGQFTTVAGTSRAYAGAVADVNAWSGNASANLRYWNPQPDGYVNAMATYGPYNQELILGGDFDYLATFTRAGLGQVDALGGGAARSWNPLSSATTNSVSAVVSSNQIAVGGTFTAAQGVRNIGLFDRATQVTGPIVYSPTTFGDVAVGVSTNLAINAYNRSGSMATIRSSTITVGTGLTVTGNGCSQGTMLSSNALCQITMTWNPQSAGSLSGVSVSIDLVGQPADAGSNSAVITGNAGVPGPLTFSSGAFGSVAVGATGSAVVTVTNTGTIAALPSAITPTGSGVSVSGGTCSTSSSISSGGTCTVDLAWTPTATGALSGGLLTVAYPNGSTASNSVSLTGVAQQPGPLTFSSGAFSSVDVGSSTSLTVSVTNSGDLPASPSAITVQGPGVTMSGGTCSTFAAIAAGGTCTVILTWSPQASGSLVGGALTIAYPGGPQASDSRALTGTATGGSSGGSSSGSSGGSSSAPQATAPITPPVNAAPSPDSSALPGAGAPSVTLVPLGGSVSKAIGLQTRSITPTIAPRPPTRRIRTAPRIALTTDDIVRIKVSGLPARQRYAVSVAVEGRWRPLGIIRSIARGSAVTPAFTSSTAGRFTVRVRMKDAHARYVIATFR